MPPKARTISIFGTCSCARSFRAVCEWAINSRVRTAKTLHLQRRHSVCRNSGGSCNRYFGIALLADEQSIPLTPLLI